MFTVVVPAHGRPDALHHTLTGIQVQRPGLAVVVVDNATPDLTVATVCEAHRDGLDLTLLRRPELPAPFALCSARNLALAKVDTPWTVFLDSDCVPAPGYFAALERSVDTGILGVGLRVFIEQSMVRADRLHEPGFLRSLPRCRSASNYGLSVDRRTPLLSELDRCAHPWALCHGGNLAIETQTAREVQFDEQFDGRWGYEDVDFAYRAVQHGVRPVWIEGMHVFHQEAENEQVRRADKRENPNWLRICERIPGFREFKSAQFESLGIAVSL